MGHFFWGGDTFQYVKKEKEKEKRTIFRNVEGIAPFARGEVCQARHQQEG